LANTLLKKRPQPAQAALQGGAAQVVALDPVAPGLAVGGVVLRDFAQFFEQRVVARRDDVRGCSAFAALALRFMPAPWPPGESFTVLWAGAMGLQGANRCSAVP
jgi:hypothetical protein